MRNQKGSPEFKKYYTRGAYHWKMIARNPRTHNPFVVALYEVCLEVLGDVEKLRVLDYGCGDGALTGLLMRRGAIAVGFDPNGCGLQLARKEFERRRLRAEFYEDCAEIDDSSCDAVVCCEVIEHVEDPLTVLKSIHRILKPGGIAVISTPIRLTEKPLDEEHLREFFPSEFRTLCAQIFDVREIREVLPLAARELLYYSEGILGRLLNLSLRLRSALLRDNFVLNWRGANRYCFVQIAKVQKRKELTASV